ncbi:MAG: hypothetical protein U5P41_00710 [Gammaproteobacteria bacterium]|nr:hypothetical protein [Gammaproteobacteria bacterium]
MLRNFIIIIMLVIFMQPAAARMYQWVDPVSGRTQLSGTPPAWYRSGDDAPRVFVFEKGQLVDDTGVTVEEGATLAAAPGSPDQGRGKHRGGKAQGGTVGTTAQPPG